MKKRNLVTLITVLFAFSLLFVSSSLAGLYVRPAKLGILRLTISPLFPAKATGNFEVGNTYNYSISINLTVSENVSSIMSLSEYSFSLQPNETKKVEYEITVTEPKVYTGNVQIAASSAEGKAQVGYQAEIAIIAGKSGFDSNTLIGAAVLVFVIVLALAYFKFLKKRKPKGKMLAATLFCFAFLFLFSSNVLAADVAMVVKDATALSPEHEQPIYNILESMDHNVTLVDKNVIVDYYNHDLIVVAGRPLSSTLDDFVANVPVNKIPTIAIDYRFLDDWGWTGFGGRSSYGTNQVLKLYIRSINPITQGFLVGDILDARTVKGYTAVDMVRGGTNFTFVATADADGKTGLIAYAPPKTQLVNGKSIADDSAAIFIGVSYPSYWSDQTIQIFKNSVTWLLNLEFEPPTIPVLSGPSTAKTSATYTWTTSSDTSGIQYYQFQLSKVSDFSSTVLDLFVNGLQYAASGLKDGTIYYARVRAVDNIGVPSDWSNVVKTVVDLTNIILKINSPTQGTVLHLNDTITVDIDVNAPRLLDGDVCTITIGGEFIANITYSKVTGKCSSSITIPTNLDGGAIGATSFTASATNSVGSTNSTNIPIFMDRALTISVSTDKSSYSASETVKVSGYVKTSDNNAAVKGASVIYNVSSKSDSSQTDSSGKFIFNIANLDAGSYTLNVKVNYNGVQAANSTSFSISSSTGGTTGGGGSSWSSSYLPALWIDANDIEAYENTAETFTVKVRNIGTIAVHDVKVLLTETDLKYDVEPNLIDLDSEGSQEYKITLQIPDNTVGKYELTIKAVGYETYKTKKITLTVLPKILIPVLQAVSIELPKFVEGQTNSLNITIQNTGNLTATATTSVSLPENWAVESPSQTLEIKPGEQQKFSFLVTPSNISGQVKFDVEYLANDQEKTLSYSTDVTVNPKPEEKKPQSITGMIVAALVLPEVYIPSAAAIILLSIFLFRKNLINLKGISKSFFGHKENVLATPKRKITPASNYLRWERKYTKG
jgi:hypothetical protein